MKKTSFLIALSAVVLAACSGSGNGGGNADADSTQTAATEEEPVEEPKEEQALFQYVEPQQEIAKEIWTKLLETDGATRKHVAEAKTWSSGKEDFQSKTRMKYESVLDGPEGSWDGLAYYLMQCYQTKDGDWTAVMLSKDGYEEAILQSFLYKDGKLSDNTEQTQIPEPQSPVFGHASGFSYCAIDFDTTGFTLLQQYRWPLRYNWDGEKFQPSPNNVNLSSQFNIYGNLGGIRLGYTPDYNLSYSAPWGKIENNILIDKASGEKILQYELNDDGKITGLNILSPKIGFAQTTKGCSNVYSEYDMYRVTSKPVAIGFPIKNVLDYTKEDEEKDQNITTETKDGYYTITQRLYRDKSDKRDIMISFAAKDANSNIEKMRYYAEPLKITFESELADNKDIKPEIKDIWNKLNSKYKPFEALGEFISVNFSRNGFRMKCADNGAFPTTDKTRPTQWNFYCFMFKNPGGKYTILTQKDIENTYFVAESQKAQLYREFAQYSYQNGTLTQVPFSIPKTEPSDYPSYKNDKTTKPAGDGLESDPSTLVSKLKIPRWDGCMSDINIDCYSINLRASSTHTPCFCEFQDEDFYIGNYEIRCFWDGSNFVPEEKLIAAEKALALEIYSKIPAEDLHYDYKSISEKDISDNYNSRKVTLMDIGFQNDWQRDTKMKMDAQRTANGYDVFYYTQTAPDAEKQLLKYTYNGGVLTKVSISQNEVDSLKKEWGHVMKD